ncbi:MAG TPA: hypothetical protein DCZ75_02575 [Geobacter sp.]|nr:hypothetical protein [Geobacter sp.]
MLGSISEGVGTTFRRLIIGRNVCRSFLLGAFVLLLLGATAGKGVCATIGSGLPGDIDGDGTVTIAEVQKTINSFLGMNLPTDVSAVLPATWYCTNYPQSGAITSSGMTFKSDGTYSTDGQCLVVAGYSPSTGKWALRQHNILQMQPDGDSAQGFALPLSYDSSQIIFERNGDVAVLTKTPYSASYTVSGKVLDASDQPVSGVLLSTGNSRYAYTDSAGNYSMSGILNGSYTITPYLGGAVFSPVSKSFTVAGANPAAQNFVATTVPSIKVNLSGAPSTVYGFNFKLKLPSGISVKTDTYGQTADGVVVLSANNPTGMGEFVSADYVSTTRVLSVTVAVSETTAGFTSGGLVTVRYVTAAGTGPVSASDFQVSEVQLFGAGGVTLGSGSLSPQLQ